MLSEIVQSLVSHPWVYDRIQALAGVRRIHQHLMPHFTRIPGAFVLDVGGGTGNLLSLIPRGSQYICLDCDVGKLRELHRKAPNAVAIVGSAAALPLAERSIESVVCVAVTHHLPPEILHQVLGEMARVCTRRLILLDAERVPHRLLSNLLWKYDQGRFPYTGSELHTAVAKYFRVWHFERFTIYHRYVFMIGDKVDDASS